MNRKLLKAEVSNTGQSMMKTCQLRRWPSALRLSGFPTRLDGGPMLPESDDLEEENEENEETGG